MTLWAGSLGGIWQFLLQWSSAPKQPAVVHQNAGLGAAETKLGPGAPLNPAPHQGQQGSLLSFPD